MNTPTPAASRAATPSVPESVMTLIQQYGDARTDARGSAAAIMELVLGLRRWAAELTRSEAAQPASPAPLTDERLDVLMELVEEYGGAREESALFNARIWPVGKPLMPLKPRLAEIRAAIAALASPQVAPAPIECDDHCFFYGTGATCDACERAPLPMSHQHDVRDAIRREAFEEAADAAESEATGEPADEHYDSATRMCAAAIRALAAPVQVAPQDDARDAVKGVTGERIEVEFDDNFLIRWNDSIPDGSYYLVPAAKPAEPTQGEQA